MAKRIKQSGQVVVSFNVDECRHLRNGGKVDVIIANKIRMAVKEQTAEIPRSEREIQWNKANEIVSTVFSNSFHVEDEQLSSLNKELKALQKEAQEAIGKRDAKSKEYYNLLSKLKLSISERMFKEHKIDKYLPAYDKYGYLRAFELPEPKAEVIGEIPQVEEVGII